MMDFLTNEFYGNSIKNWLIAAGIILGSIFLAKLTYHLIGKTIKQITARTKTRLDDILVDKLQEPGVMAIIVICCAYALSFLDLSKGADSFFDKAFTFALAIDITWFVVRAIDAIISEFLAPYAQKSDTKIDDSLIPILKRTIKMIIWSIGIIMALNNAGFDVGALIAGLGIGGLALALASQDTVKNIIGGLIIILDKPFKIGDRIMIDAFDGTVEDIGVRSTRIRTLEGRQVTLPNMSFSDKPIVNITREPSRKITLILGLVYNTSPEKIDLAVETLRNIANSQDKVEKENTKSLFSGFGLHSLDITLIYFIEAGNDFLDIQNAVNQEILRTFKDLDLEFAYPTQTIYTAQKQ